MKLGIHKGSSVTDPLFEKLSRLGENGINLLKNIFFLSKISIFVQLNISQTKEITAKPMVLSYVGHFYKGKKTIF